jgi:hypothetical protein
MKIAPTTNKKWSFSGQKRNRHQVASNIAHFIRQVGADLIFSGMAATASEGCNENEHSELRLPKLAN